MFVVHFSQPWATKFVDAIKHGEPISPPSGAWTGNEMLTLAGMLYAAVYSQGPHSHQAAGVTAAQAKKLPEERREAIEETLTQDIHDAIEFVSMLTFKVIDNEYDEACAPEIKAIVYRDGNNKTVMPIEGFKKTS